MCTPTGLSLLKNFNHNEGLNGTIIRLDMELEIKILIILLTLFLLVG